MTSEANIRKAEAVDLPACAKIINDWIDETRWMPRIEPADVIASNFEPELLAHRHFLVAEVENEIAGYLSADPQKQHIHGLYVATRFRDCGTGKALIDQTKDAFPNHLTLWTFQANEKAQKFYHREGFVEVRRTEGENTEKLPDILFEWKAESGS